jgi:hypothetical protein
VLKTSRESSKACLPKWVEIVSQHICNKIYVALATHFSTSWAVIQATCKLQEPVSQYGKAIRLKGDQIVANKLVQSSEDTWDASYIKVCLVTPIITIAHSNLQYIQTVDRFARQWNRTPELVPYVFFGQLKCLLVLEVPPIPQLLQDAPSKIIYAVVQSIRSFQENNMYYYSDLGPVEISTQSSVLWEEYGMGIIGV